MSNYRPVKPLFKETSTRHDVQKNGGNVPLSQS